MAASEDAKRTITNYRFENWLMTMCALAIALVLTACHIDPPHTEQALRSFVGRPLADFISANGYPDSSVDLPSGNRAYVFSRGQYVDRVGMIRGCRIWIETNHAGLIATWRYENCE